MISGRGPAFALPLVAFALAAAAACSSNENAGVVAAEAGADASAPPEDGAAPVDAAREAGSDAGPGSCEGACKTTTLEADFGGKKRALVRAQFGTQPGDGGTDLHTESHAGGSPACPTQQSPSTDYTFIVSVLPRGAVGRALSDRDGLTSTFFDFKDDLGLPPFTKAVSVNVTVTAEDTATPPAWIAFDVSAGFREGKVSGHVYAELCQSLSE